MINVLCLHGCNQSEGMFRELMKNYVRLGEKQYNLKFHFMEAQYNHPNGGKTWYNKPLDVKEIGSIVYDEELTKDALTHLNQVINEYNIDVLLGFSQGANVVDTFMTHGGHPNIKRVVLMSGYSLIDLSNKMVDTPCLAVISESDTVVPHILNPTNYHESHIFKHYKGHKLPTSNKTIRDICIFIQTGKCA